MDLSMPAGTPAPPHAPAFEDMDGCGSWTCRCLAKLRAVRLAVAR
jgi:hypothetical protein